MRPVKLFLKNIGPYKSQEIDFSNLDNMFLIRGKTGSGKTFIFDAMTFALYGELRGNRKGHASDLKSRYAEDGDESFVEFTFSLGNELYRVHRTVPFKYVKRTGKLDKKISEVDFGRIVQGKFTAISEKLEETNSRIQALIGLTVDEFAQIVLLPQGAFAEFLKQNSKERTVTLQKLFPVSCYSNMMERIHQKYGEAQKELETVKTGIDTILDGRDFSSAEETIQRLDEEISSEEKQVAALLKKRETLASELTGLQRDFQDSLEIEEKKNRLEKLQSSKKDFDSLEEKISLAEKANVLREFINGRNDLFNESVSLEAKLSESEREFLQISESLAALKKEEASMEKLKDSVKLIFSQISETEKKLESAGELDSLVAEEKQLCENLKKIEESKNNIEESVKNLKAPYEPDGIDAVLSIKNSSHIQKEKELSVSELALSEAKKRESLLSSIKNADSRIALLEKENETAEKQLSDLKESISRLDEKIKETMQKGAAYSVAEKLKPGCPCPVCGSLEHPSPCEKPDDILDSGKQLELQKGLLPSAENELKRIQQELGVARGEGASFQKQLEEIKNKISVTDAQSEYDTCMEGRNRLVAEIKALEKAKEQVSLLEKELSEKVNLHHEVVEDYVKVSASKVSLEKNLGEPVEVLKKKAVEQKDLYENENNRLLKWEEEYRKAGEACSAAEEAVRQRKDSREENCKKLAQAEKVLQEKLSASIFQTVEMVQNAMMDQEILSGKRKELLEYQKELKSVQDALKDSDKLDASEMIREKISKVQEKTGALNDEYEKQNGVLEAKKAERHSLHKDFQKVREKLDELAALREKVEPLKRLDDDLCGKNPRKLQFDAWALGMYFEQVVDFASVRFFDISNGRFEFRLKEISADSSGRNLKGLDLQVYDYFTGNLTDPCELSGGETFEASISLALAITDVVQNNSGGISLDSLFIDEGFGTLDTETLDKAMAVLTELGETKMIGIISHVEGLTTVIPSAIKVHKTKSGSSVEIV